MATKHTSPEATTNAYPSTETKLRQSTWTAAEKLAILAEYEAYPRGHPRRGELLRRVGADTSHMAIRREQRERGTLTSTQQPSIGRPEKPCDHQQAEIARLQQEVARLQAKLHKATTVIDIQKKFATGTPCARQLGPDSSCSCGWVMYRSSGCCSSAPTKTRATPCRCTSTRMTRVQQQ